MVITQERLRTRGPVHPRYVTSSDDLTTCFEVDLNLSRHFMPPFIPGEDTSSRVLTHRQASPRASPLP